VGTDVPSGGRQFPCPNRMSVNVTSPANPRHVFLIAKYVVCEFQSKFSVFTSVTMVFVLNAGMVTISDPPPPPNPKIRSFGHVDVAVTCNVHISPCLQPGWSRIPANWSLVNTTDHRR
jgi:hypothetical protein